MAILLALFSAFAYGLSDFVGGLVSRRVSAWPVAVVGQLSSMACTAAVALMVGGSPTKADLAWALLAGIGTGVGTGFLYRGFAAGRMGVVAPVSAVGAAVVPVVVGAVGGERLSLVVWTGIVVALPGIWLVSSTTEELPDGAARPRGSLAEGVLDGVLAGLGFGVLFAALGQVPEEAGLWPLALAQAVSLPAVIVLAVSLGAAWFPRRRQAWWALLAGPLGASAAGAFLLATQSGYLTVAGILASLYPASTVLLAALVLHEKVHRAQGVGLGLCALAIALVAGGG
ncbi:MAG TPA: DMT family transporter [Nocardioidaceae bacterium]|nr:DMT family transporter [Nocardioidaceae bacterium]